MAIKVNRRKCAQVNHLGKIKLCSHFICLQLVLIANCSTNLWRESKKGCLGLETSVVTRAFRAKR